MFRKRVLLTLAVAVAASLAIMGQAISQQGPPGGQGRGGGPAMTPEQQQQRMDQFRQQAMDRAKQDLGATDEEWKVLSPLVEKVQTLSRASRMGGMGFGGVRGGRGGPQPGGKAPDATAAPATPRPGMPAPSEVDLKVQALRTVLDNKEATPAQIKEALTGVRDARAKADKDLKKAQKALRDVVTVRQEAVCVMNGWLD